MTERLRRHFHDYWNGFTASQQTAATVGLVLTLLTAIALPIYAIWFSPLLNRWRVDQAMEQAADFEAAQDYRNLLLSIRRASQLGSSDVRVWRQIADYLTFLGDPGSLGARRQVIDLDPEAYAARVEMAETALLFGELKTAQNALSAAEGLAATDADYLTAASTLSLLLGDVDAMTAQLERLTELEPENHRARFELSVARLWSPKPAVRETGRNGLVDLLGENEYRVRASIELLKDASRTQDEYRLGELLPILLTRLSFPPGLRPNTGDFPTLLLGLKTSASTNPQDVSAVAAWMIEIRLGDEALPWIHSLSADVRQHPSVQEIAAEIAVREDQLKAATHYLIQGAFGEAPSEAVVLALGARQLQLGNRPSVARSSWDESLRLAGENRYPRAFRVLARLAGLWQEPHWAEAALQASIKRAPNEFWAYSALREHLLHHQKSIDLWDLYTEWIQRQPDDTTVVLQWFRLGSSLPTAHDDVLAEAPARLAELPESPRRKAALAGWHWLQGDKSRAHALLAQSGSAAFHEPDAAFWAALITGASDPFEAYPILRQLQLAPSEREMLGLPELRAPSKSRDLREWPQSLLRKPPA